MNALCPINEPTNEPTQAIEPLPQGVIEEGMNPEDAEILLRYRYVEAKEDALYYFITYDGIFVKGFRNLAMAQAVHYALVRTWKRQYARITSRICRIIAEEFVQTESLTEEQCDEILGAVAFQVRAYG